MTPSRLTVPCPHCDHPFVDTNRAITRRCKNNKKGFSRKTCDGCYREAVFFLDENGDLTVVSEATTNLHPLDLLGLNPDTL